MAAERVSPDRWREVEALFDAVADSPPQRVSELLAQAEPDMRREVESLLAQRSRQGPLDAGAADLLDSESIAISNTGSTAVNRLEPGMRLGPYAVMSRLGSGGMGMVYEAEDTRLGRRVAIKLLHDRAALFPDAIERFRQEARTASALNHPNICTVYDVGEHESRPFIVMELVEGRTLRELQRKCPLQIATVLRIGIQVAEALDALHARGIVHRDLKSTNVLVSEAGQAKVMDFGIAKLSRPDLHTPGSDLEAGTSQLSLTATGITLGTVAFMSPEQARGEIPDRRSDLFSLGVVLYEMITRKLPFPGRTAAVVFEAILNREPPPPGTLNPSTPSELDQITLKALEKDRDMRYQTAADLGADLKRLRRRIASGKPSRSVNERRAFASRPAWLLVFSVAGLLAASSFLAGRYFSTGGESVTGSDVVTVNRLTDFDGVEEFPAISPDGKSVAFSADRGGSRQVWIRLIAGGPAVPLTSGPGDHLGPRWAPDSASLIYFSPAREGETHGTLWEVSALGGQPRRIGPSGGSADISPDGRELAFFRDVYQGVELVVSSRDGSGVRSLAEFPAELLNYFSPRWSPDGTWIAFGRAGTNFDFVGEIFAVPAAGGDLRRILPDENYLRGFDWLPDGSGILYSSSRGSTIPYVPRVNLWTVGLDGGNPRQVTFGASYVEPDINASGTIVSGERTVDFDIWKFPVDGTPESNVRRAVRVTRQTADVYTPSPAPDDSKLVYLSNSGGHANLWITSADGEETRQITFQRDPAVIVALPRWSPDGSRITFYMEDTDEARTDRKIGQWLVNPDGTDLRYLVFGAWAEWSSDGRWLYYATRKQDVYHIEKVSMADGSSVTVRTDSALAPIVPAQGDALYYVVRAPGGLEIRVARPENGPSELLYRVPPSRAGLEELFYFQPSLSPDGTTLALFLRDGYGTNLFALPTSGGQPRRLTDFGERRISIVRRVSWSSDGKYLFAAVGDAREDVVLLDGLRVRKD
jgi:eukaryotic-like serine/threonine-protein kinase